MQKLLFGVAVFGVVMVGGCREELLPNNPLPEQPAATIVTPDECDQGLSWITNPSNNVTTEELARFQAACPGY